MFTSRPPCPRHDDNNQAKTKKISRTMGESNSRSSVYKTDALPTWPIIRAMVHAECSNLQYVLCFLVHRERESRFFRALPSSSLSLLLPLLQHTTPPSVLAQTRTQTRSLLRGPQQRGSLPASRRGDVNTVCCVVQKRHEHHALWRVLSQVAVGPPLLVSWCARAARVPPA